VRSTNPLERLKKEVKRRSDVVGMAPAERHDAWPIGQRDASADALALLLADTALDAALPALIAA
jgi:hypothetical protein